MKISKKLSSLMKMIGLVVVLTSLNVVVYANTDVLEIKMEDIEFGLSDDMLEKLEAGEVVEIGTAYFSADNQFERDTIQPRLLGGVTFYIWDSPVSGSIKSYEFAYCVFTTDGTFTEAIKISSAKVVSTCILFPDTYYSKSNYSFVYGAHTSYYGTIGYFTPGDDSVYEVKVQCSGIQVYLTNAGKWTSASSVNSTISLP